MSPKLIHDIFQKLYGIPCWNVRQGWGSFATFEFGNPRQEVERVIERENHLGKPYPTRLVIIRGDWNLWIYCCAWRISQDGNVLANNESNRDCIMAACDTLHGQALSEFIFRAGQGQSRFKFDLGGKLTTEPCDDELSVQWMLFCPDGYVLSYHSDGAFSYEQSDSKQEAVFSVIESD